MIQLRTVTASLLLAFVTWSSLGEAARPRLLPSQPWHENAAPSVYKVTAGANRHLLRDPKLPALMDRYGHSAVTWHLATHPYSSADQLGKALAREDHPLTELRPQDFDQPTAHVLPQGWSVRVTPSANKRRVEVVLTGPHGESGRVTHDFDPVTGELVLNELYRGSLPGTIPWVRVGPGIKARELSQVPTIAYASSVAAHVLGATRGRVSRITVGRVQHVQSLAQVDWLLRQNEGADLEDVVGPTFWPRYTQRVATAIGVRPAGDRVRIDRQATAAWNNRHPNGIQRDWKYILKETVVQARTLGGEPDAVKAVQSLWDTLDTYGIQLPAFERPATIGTTDHDLDRLAAAYTKRLPNLRSEHLNFDVGMKVR